MTHVTRVMLVNAYCPPYAPGGAEWSMLALAKGLRDEGVETIILTPRYGVSPQVPAGLRVVEVSSPFRLSPGVDLDATEWLDSRAFVSNMAAAIRAEWKRGTVVHLQGAPVLSPGIASGRRPLVFTARDTAALCPSGWCLMTDTRKPPRCCRGWGEQLKCAWHFSGKIPHGSRPLRRLLSQPKHWRRWRRAQRHRHAVDTADAVIAVSAALRDTLIENLVAHPNRIYAVRNIAPDWSRHEETARYWRAKLRLPLDSEVVLYVGKRSFGKGTPILESAMASVVERCPQAVLLLVGKGYRPSQSPHLRTLETISNDDMAGVYSLASCVVMPSVWPEPLSRVLLEAAVLGVPLVASDVGGSSEIVVPGQTGWLVPRMNSSALAAAIAEVLAADRESIAKITGAAREHVLRLCGRATIISETLEVYKAAAVSCASAS
jgi:glycosyltransferase involved in cell wall biosynthesis